jgi:hypothetical protein
MEIFTAVKKLSRYSVALLPLPIKQKYQKLEIVSCELNNYGRHAETQRSTLAGMKLVKASDCVPRLELSSLASKRSLNFDSVFGPLWLSRPG